MSDRMKKPSDDPAIEDPQLQNLEARLAERLVACPTTIDRDQLLYQAGWEAAEAKASRPLAAWRWPTATGVMTAATVALVFLQLDSRQRLEGLEQQVAAVAVVEEVSEPEFVPPPQSQPQSQPTLQKRPAWPLLAAWGLAPEPVRRERGAALSAHWVLRDGIDPLEEWDRTRLVHTTQPNDSSDEPFPTRRPATARELMKEWLPTPVRRVPSPPLPIDSTTDPAQQRARIHPSIHGDSIV